MRFQNLISMEKLSKNIVLAGGIGIFSILAFLYTIKKLKKRKSKKKQEDDFRLFETDILNAESQHGVEYFSVR